MKKKLFDSPSHFIFVSNEFTNTKQRVYRFDNGYGASIIQIKMAKKIEEKDYFLSYTSNDQEWELAVLKFSGKDSYTIVYDTNITSDVLGHLTEIDVESILQKIKNLKPKRSKYGTSKVKTPKRVHRKRNRSNM